MGGRAGGRVRYDTAGDGAVVKGWCLSESVACFDAWVYGRRGDLEWTVGRRGKQQTKQNGSEDGVENKLDKHSETWTARKMDGTGKGRENRECGMERGTGSVSMEHGTERGAGSVERGI
jgi:hypothetical protein